MTRDKPHTLDGEWKKLRDQRACTVFFHLGEAQPQANLSSEFLWEVLITGKERNGDFWYDCDHLDFGYMLTL